MGKPINKNTKDLNELLGHLKKPTDELDAFEQEALEGFASLESKEEAIELKSHLDERMEKEVLLKKRKPLFIYWSAAAGIALLAGLIFVFNINNSFEKKALADNSVRQAEEQKNLEGGSTPQEELSENELGAKKTKSEKSNERLDGAISQSSEQARASAGDQSDDATTSLAESDSRNEESTGKSDKNTLDSEDKPLGDLASSKSSEPQKPGDNDAGAGMAGNSKSKAKDEEDEKEQNSADIVFARKIKKSKSAEAPAPKTAPASQEVKSEINGPFENSSIKPAKLTISEDELNKLITKFFADKSYKKSFKCTLTINNSNKVEEIVFENKKLFKKSEIKEITSFFQKQKCFKNNEFALYSTYKINYVSE